MTKAGDATSRPLLEMKVKDYFTQGRWGWVRLHEKSGKEHEVPCHHTLERFLDDYIAAADIGGENDGPLFRSVGRKTGGGEVMWQQDVYRMIQRRATIAGIATKIGNHTFRPTGITAYLKNGGTLSMLRLSPTTLPRAPQSSMTGGAMKFPSMRLKRFRFSTSNRLAGRPRVVGVSARIQM